MAPRFCAECGKPWTKDARFCVECGAQAQGTSTSRWTASPAALGVTTILAIAALGVLTLNASPGEKQHPLPGPQAQPNLPRDHPPIEVPPEARQMLAQLAEQAAAKPDDLDLWLRLADGQYRAGRIDASYFPQAQASYQHVLSVDPANLRALRGLGNISYDRKETDRAVEFYERYLEHDPKNAEVRTDLGSMLFGAGQTERAIEIYRKVIAEDATLYQPHFNLGLALNDQGKQDEARVHWERARELAPNPRVRERIDAVIARLTESNAPQNAPQNTPTGGDQEAFQAAVEKLLREHAIMGPRITAIDWPSPATARVRLSSFPMAAMPEDVRTRFVEKLRSQIHEAKLAAQVTGTARVDLVDDAAGGLLEQIVDQ